MRVGILTLPLHTNYGGILQAYALQTVLERMGHEVVVINKPYHLSLPIWKWPYSYPKRFIRKYILGKGGRVFFESYYNYTYPIIGQYTHLFIDKYIHQFEVRDLSELKEQDFDAFVVGSDQVWRPVYYSSKIENAYLSFAKDWNIKRIAYAASFGMDEWEYTRGQTKRCSELLAKFDAVSVREEQGIKLCREHFGVEPVHVLDPTMLLGIEDYRLLVRRANVPKSSNHLMCYILDETVEKTMLVSRLVESNGLEIFRSNSPNLDLYAPLKELIWSPVEQWLHGLMSARMVVTDSFHGCVFSILFHKPFVVIGNKERGLSRIESLLKMFGLEERLYEKTSTIPFSKPIDWEHVDVCLTEWRKKSLGMLYLI